MTTYNVESRYKEPLALIVGGALGYTNASTVTLTVDARDDHVRVLVLDDTPRRQYVLSSDNLTCNLAVSGPGGLHDSYNEQNNLVYEVRVAWNSRTAKRDGTICLFAVPDQTVVNDALMLLLGAGQYDMWSDPIGYAINNGGNILPTNPDADGWTWFLAAQQILTNGVAIIATGINLGTLVPSTTQQIAIRTTVEHNGVLEAACTFSTYDGANTVAFLTQPATASVAGDHRLQGDSIRVPVLNTAPDSLRYIWDIAPTVGANVWLLGFKLPA